MKGGSKKKEKAKEPADATNSRRSKKKFGRKKRPKEARITDCDRPVTPEREGERIKRV